MSTLQNYVAKQVEQAQILTILADIRTRTLNKYEAQVVLDTHGAEHKLTAACDIFEEIYSEIEKLILS